MKLFFLFSMIISFSYKLSAYSETINIAWDTWCPWFCESNENPGFLIELVENVFKYSKTNIQFQKYTWVNGLTEVRQGRIFGMIGTSKYEAPDFIFPNEHIAVQQMCFYVKNNSSWIYKNLDSLNEVSIGVLREANYPSLMKYIHANSDNPKKVQIIETQDVSEQGFTELKKNKIDVFLNDIISADYYLIKNKLTSDFKRLDCLEKEKIYLSFSPKLKDKSLKLAKIFDTDYKKYRQTDDYQRLIKKYHIKYF
ncbi:substrate-binding periplasmic protein [Silvanigrella aquatica]|uniref:Solute-binding protein family 3/N-terminal domain-containing protein n=1 Tax=Silvanigrella aquatica TaxID=1915309 RepID=A0A1L4D399_9BACT|nr:transporter substrate-binding domain-containing protein [Silvanigrella aquatica]APJ04678.1 hypothetical protein AXG55_12505 [Silvanigrella aquatica]